MRSSSTVLVDSARATAEANGLAAQLTVLQDDAMASLPDASADLILLNPPFHTGQATDVDLGRAFLKTAITSLKRGGKLFLVANRQLPYEAVLEAAGLAWRKTAEDKSYKLLFADKR